jgi:hypothetical protein
MSVVVTPDGFKIVDNSGAGNNTATSGGGASNTGSGGPTFNPAVTPPASMPGNGVLDSGSDTTVGVGAGNDNASGNGVDAGVDAGVGVGVGVGGNQGQDAAAVPEPSTVALMLAGMLGVAGLKRRRAR